MRLRRGAWIVLPLVGAAVGGLAWLTQSAWLGRGLEAGLEALLRRDVAVEGARLDPFTLQARLERLRIADRDDPRRWAFDGGPAVLDVAFWPLLEGKWVIEDLRLVDVTGGTPRRAPAAAPSPPPAESPAPESGPGLVERLKAALPRLDLAPVARRLDLDALLSERPLATVAWADDQARAWRARIDAWQAKVDEMAAIDGELRDLKRRIDALDLDTRDPAELRRQLKELKAIRDQARALRDRLRAARRGLAEDLRFPLDREGLARAREQDMALLQRLAGLDLERVADALFGAPVVERLGTLLAYLKQGRDLLAGDDPEPPPPPPRRAGRDFVFPADPPPPPRLLLINGRLQGDWPGRGPFDLRLAHLASAPAAWSEPLSLDLALGRDHPWRLAGTLDHRQGRDEDRLELAGDGLDLGRIPLATPEGQPLPRAVTLGAAQVTGRLDQSGGRLDGRIRLQARQVRFHFPQRIDPAYAAVADDLRAVFDQARARLELSVRVAGTVDAPRLHLASSLDQDLAKRLRTLLGEKLEDARRRLRERLDQEAETRLADARAELEARAAPLEARLKDWQEAEKQLETRLKERQKALEDRLQARLKAAGERLEEKAREKLDEALKKGLKGLGL